jgi:hypothetical protein
MQISNSSRLVSAADDFFLSVPVRRQKRAGREAAAIPQGNTGA